MTLIKEMDRRLYRGQYFLGQKRITLPDWRHIRLEDKGWLSVHPDLNVVELRENGFEALLLGYLLDPERTEDDDKAILKRLCQSAGDGIEFIRATETLGGRWLIFLSGHGSDVVFNDAGGTLTLFYHQDNDKQIWMATQPGLLAEQLGFLESPESIEYTQSPRFKERHEAWWPGECSPYEEVKQLLPNHLYDFSTNKVIRYWPYEKLDRQDFESSIPALAQMLKGLLTSAHNRFPLAVSLSSGLDSRLVLSACKDFIADIPVYSFLYRTLTEESDDVRVPVEMAAKLEFNHQVIDFRSKAPAEVQELFDRNVKGLKVDWVDIVAGRIANIPADKVLLKGTISEIMRCRYFGLGVHPPKVTLEDCVSLMALGDAPLVVNNLSSWLEEARPYAEKYNVKLLDLLSWEIEVGNWYDMGYTVFGLAQREFTLFNSRRFFTIMQGIDPKYRSYPFHIAQRRITAYLWPELADFPYTPSRTLPTKKFTDTKLYYILRSLKREIIKK
jgi:hypothetical protein